MIPGGVPPWRGRGWAAALAVAGACQGPSGPPPDDSGTEVPFTCPRGVVGVRGGVVTDERVVEASGLAWGGGDVWWTHNDSGDSARIFAVRNDGRVTGSAELQAASAIDVEDIAVRPKGDGRELIVGDIGDNGLTRAGGQLYLLDAPDPGVDGVAPVARVDVTFDDGASHDVEALMADPVDGAIYAVEKALTRAPKVWALPADLGLSAVFEHVLSLDLHTDADIGVDPLITGATVSPDGAWIAVRSYLGVRIWQRVRGERVVDALARPACVYKLAAEPQGEAIGWDDAGFVTISEGAAQPLIAYAWP